MPVNRKVPKLGPRLSIVDANGKRIARLGGEDGPGLASGKFLAPRGIALDSKGDMYAGEVGVSDWKTNPDEDRPRSAPSGACRSRSAWRRLFGLDRSSRLSGAGKSGSTDPCLV